MHHAVPIKGCFPFKTIIFDFGDVFINLDKEGALKLALEKFEITDEDVKTVINQANCSKEDALEALKHSEGDIAEAIISLND